MENFRLKVFYTVSKNKSFTKAAAELFITQPAITKHIKHLEEELGVMLFERRGSFIEITTAGKILHKYASEIFQLYQEARFEIGTLKNQYLGNLRLGASTTIAQYLISPVLASFYEKFPKTELSLLNGNTELIVNAVLDKNIDLGIVEGRKQQAGLKYTDFMEDELVPVVKAGSRFSHKDIIELEDLKQIPLIMREYGSGTLEVIEGALKEQGVKLSNLPVIMNLGSTESIKSFLEHSNALSFFSPRAVQKEVTKGDLKILTINGFKISRRFSFVHLQGQQDSLSTAFMRFANRYYNQR
jgi:DNA-binding transcriptional LysR family regulator